MAQAYYSPDVVQTGQVPSTQTNFPRLFLPTDNRFRTIGNGGHVANANGYDIRPYSNAGLTTALTYELVPGTYNASTGFFEMWILVAPLADGNTIYFGYGDASLTTDGSGNPWPSQYKLVAHLPNGSSLNVNDSTSNSNNLTNHGATATAGLIDGAAAFNGTTQYADLPNITHSTTVNTVSGRFVTTDVTTEQRVFARGGSGPSGNDFSLQIFSSAVRGLVAGDGGSGLIVGSSTSISNNASYVFQLVFDGATLKLYLNGSQASSDAAVATIAASTSQNYLASRNNGAQTSFLSGSVDEFRDSNIAPTANWITTEYNNQSAPGTFSVLGTEVANGTDTSVTPGVATLTITKFTPSLVLGTQVTPGVIALTTTKFTPSLVLGTQVTPGVASLTITKFAPSAVLGTQITPGVKALTITLFAASVSTVTYIAKATVELRTQNIRATIEASPRTVILEP